jgi:hypothetical protein
MLARCARCQGTFTTDRFGLQTCPHCGSELLLADPGAAPPAPPAPEGEAPPSAAPQGPPAWGAPPPPPQPGPGAPPPGYGPPPGGWGPPSGGGQGGYPPPPGGPGPPGGPVETALPAPFAERGTRGFFRAFFETWKLAAVQPQQFFRRVRIDQSRSAVLFAVISFTFGTAAETLYGWLTGQQVALFAERLAGYLPPDQAQAFRDAVQSQSGPRSLGQIVVAPVLAVILVYLLSAIFHLLLLLLKGAQRGFDATVTVVAYGFGLSLLLAVPGCGFPIAAVWATVVWIVGLGESQRCGPGKAAAAVFAPLLLVCFCCCGAAGLGFGGFLKAMQAAQHIQTTNL